MVLKRTTITIINILFPPLGVALLCGVEMDVLINCILFLCAIIPSHVHAFYISCTYFNRKRKVRKGKYPGQWRRGIYCARVQRGGASRKEVEALKREEEEMGVEKKDARAVAKRASKRKSGSRTESEYSPTGSSDTPSSTSPFISQIQWTRNSGNGYMNPSQPRRHEADSFANRASRTRGDGTHRGY